MAAEPTSATPAAQALLGALADHPGATATELAEAAGIGRSTATKLLATLAGQGRVLRQPGGHQHGRRAADHWTLPAPAAGRDRGAPTAAAPAPPTAPTPSTAPSSTGSGRLRPGALRDLVLACLAERPGQALSPTTIAKRLDRSAGAVANALQALADQGAVVQIQAKPRRYAITTAGGDQATTAG
jgi:DNA-binding MarR family transcriptional regulator